MKVLNSYSSKKYSLNYGNHQIDIVDKRSKTILTTNIMITLLYELNQKPS